MIKFFSCILLLVAGYALTDAGCVSENVDRAFFRLYNRNGSHADFRLANAAQLVPLLDKNENVTIYSPGHQENLDIDTALYVVNGLLNYTTANIIALDYRNISTLKYPTSVAQIQVLGVAVAKSIQKLVDAGVPVNKLYLVGHSLGAQLSGRIGRSLPFKLPRITGLDPAGPRFYYENRHLSASDAKFVDIIHTDAGILGLAKATGTVDYFPNFGHWPQPGCDTNDDLITTALCSHHRSWVFFVESCKNPHAFVGVRCDNDNYDSGSCDGNERAVMGYHASPETRGKYYLRTKASEPYGLGKKGAPHKSSGSEECA